MTRADLDRTQAVRAWLAAGGEELSPRVRDNVLREFPATNQDRPHWAARLASDPAPSLSVLRSVLRSLSRWPSRWSVPVCLAGTDQGVPEGRYAYNGPPDVDLQRWTPGPSPTPDTIDYSYRDVGFMRPGSTRRDTERPDPH